MKIGLLGFGTVGPGVYELAKSRNDMSVAKVLLRRELELADAVVTHDINDIVGDAYKGIILMEEFFKSLNMPTRLEELGISKDDIEQFTLALTKNKTVVIKDVVDINYDNGKEIFSLMFE